MCLGKFLNGWGACQWMLHIFSIELVWFWRFWSSESLDNLVETNIFLMFGENWLDYLDSCAVWAEIRLHFRKLILFVQHLKVGYLNYGRKTVKASRSIPAWFIQLWGSITPKLFALLVSFFKVCWLWRKKQAAVKVFKNWWWLLLSRTGTFLLHFLACVLV